MRPQRCGDVDFYFWYLLLQRSLEELKEGKFACSSLLVHGVSRTRKILNYVNCCLCENGLNNL